MNAIYRQIGVAVIVGAAVVTGVLLLTRARAAAQDQPAPQAQRIRIGTYDSRAVAVAYAGSDQNRKRIQGWQEELKQAEAAKDKKRVAEIKAKGESAQRLMHMQGFSTAPVNDILAVVQDQLPAVARQTQVIAIVRKADFHDAAGAELVDVTNELVKLFNPTEKTLQTMEELRQKEPIALEVIATMSPRG